MSTRGWGTSAGTSSGIREDCHEPPTGGRRRLSRGGADAATIVATERGGRCTGRSAGLAPRCRRRRRCRAGPARCTARTSLEHCRVARRRPAPGRRRADRGHPGGCAVGMRQTECRPVAVDRPGLAVILGAQDRQRPAVEPERGPRRSARHRPASRPGRGPAAPCPGSGRPQVRFRDDREREDECHGGVDRDDSARHGAPPAARGKPAARGTQPAAYMTLSRWIG